MKFINVSEDSYPLWEFCKKEGFTDSDYDTWYNNGGELQFFEGDPDMIKINGLVGYFAKCGDVVFYYFDEFYGNAEKMLRKFFRQYETGTTLGGESWIAGSDPWGVTDIEENHWEQWRKMQTGIAYRGGAGYTYWASDWHKYYNRYIS